jgi:GH35 family endo-1,4-beta-xylanase
MINRRGFISVCGAMLARPLLPFSAAVPATTRASIRATGRYPGMDADAPWRRAALQRIEDNRKADFTVRIIDKAGQPLAGVPLQVSLKRHQFGFGAAVQPKHLFELGDAERQAFYRDVTSRLFHRLTISNGLKWKHHAAQKHVVETMLEWCLEHCLPVRGHCLVWAGFRRIPQKFDHLRHDPEQLRRTIEHHVTEFASMYDEPLIEWDVLNEPYTEREFMDLLGDEVVADWFRLAEAANARLTRYINDYGVLTRPNARHQDFYFDYVKNLLDQGAPLQGVGFQSHIPARFEPTPPEELLATMDRFAVFGLPLQVTEFDFETQDLDLQGRYTEDFLTAVFSHPAMVGLVTWTPFEYEKGQGPKPDAAFFDWRLQQKPNGEVWEKLVNEIWSTRLELVSDEDGLAHFRGFKGTYALEARVGSMTVNGRAAFLESGDPFSLELPGG